MARPGRFRRNGALLNRMLQGGMVFRPAQAASPAVETAAPPAGDESGSAHRGHRNQGRRRQTIRLSTASRLSFETACGSGRKQRKETHRMATTANRKNTALKEAMTKTQLLEALSESTGLQRKDVASVLDQLGVVIERHLRKRAVGRLRFPVC